MNEEIILIGSQIWTAKNISITNFRNGDIISESKNQQELDFSNDHKIPTWHFKDFDKGNIQHGLFYNFYALYDSREIFPIGWMIPNKVQWEELLAYCGYLKESEMTYLTDVQFEFFNLRAVNDLKSKVSWSAGKHKGNNSSGFNALSDSNGKIASWIIKENGNLELLSLGSKLRLPISIRTERIDKAKSYCIRLIKKKLKKEANNDYDSIKIGVAEWSTSNLNTEKFRNGDKIPLAINDKEWNDFGKDGKPACCYYDYNKENINFGLLYNYFALIDKRGIAPKGYRLSSKSDWLELRNEIGKDSRNLLSLMNSKLWNRVYISGIRAAGNNSTKFNAIPSGLRRLVYITSWEGESLYESCFAKKGNYSYWWTVDGHSVYLGFSDGMEGESEYPEFNIEDTKSTHLDYLMCGLSVRCVKI
jgi:uncharacterized protein (TIGR02145 family)